MQAALISSLLKYSDQDAYSMFTTANLRPVHRWTDSSSRYSLWLLERPKFGFPLLTAPSAVSTPFGLPTPAEWHDMWAAWDFINGRMISASMLFEKPIDLRHICLFYRGHIPTFLDIHLSRLLNEPHTEPENFKVRTRLTRMYHATENICSTYSRSRCFLRHLL